MNTYTISNTKLNPNRVFILSAAHQAEYVERHIKYLNENARSADMSFVHFSGHGFRDLNERDQVVFNRNENIDTHKY